MLLIPCPYCNVAYPELEFANAGEAHIVRPTNPDALSDAEWSAVLFERSNPRGLHFERWYHIHGCGRYFNAVRDTVSDRILLTYPAGQPRPTLAEIEKLRS